MFLKPREIGVVVIGGTAIGEMDVDDRAARMLGRVIVVVVNVTGLCGVQMQEWRGEKRQEQDQPGGSRDRSPHAIHC